ncbi:hypothetical protein RB195_006136 [Necator americanus]|uniref:Peptidase aspartic putative domain-containing protein n=1 Tax=Necator americanus TaxID=51031 RepID=A0ABR1BU70_NECAM
MDHGTTLRHFAKTVVNLSSGLLLARLRIPRSRNVSNSFSAWETLSEDEHPLCIAVRRPVSPPHHYEAVNRCGGFTASYWRGGDTGLTVETHYSNKLETAISRFKNEKLESLSVSKIEGENSARLLRDSMQRLEEAIGAIDAATSKIEQVLQDYAAEFAELTQPAEKDQEDFEEYSAKAELSVTSAFDYSLLLKAKAFKSYGKMSCLMSGTSTSHAQSQECATATLTQPKRIELPTLPIPIFRGNVWEWDNFWELFKENVHSQDLPELFKFDYLLNALKEEVLESVKKFQINRENYSKALEFLHHKYGSAEELVNRLTNKLEHWEKQVSSQTSKIEPSYGAKKNKEARHQYKDSRPTKIIKKVNHIGEEAVICELHSVRKTKGSSSTVLPTGELTVKNAKTKNLRKICVLLDNGAEISFIDSSLTDDLHLPTLEETKIRLHTFGSEQVQEKICRRDQLDVWDVEGQSMSLSLLTHDVLTKSFDTPPIREEDVEFIRKLNLPIKLTRDKSTIQPLQEDIKDTELCEKFWSLETAGTEEFDKSEKEEKALVDQKVWDIFKNTIEKRNDGYYVRLPWNEFAGEDNRSIAFRRLASVWNSLRKDDKLLEQYDQLFQEQKRLGTVRPSVPGAEAT